MLSLHSVITNMFIGSLSCRVHRARYQNIAANKMDSLHGLLENRMARGAISTHSSSNQVTVRQPGSDAAESFMTHQAVHSWWSFSGRESPNMATPFLHRGVNVVRGVSCRWRNTLIQKFNLPAPCALVLAPALRLDQDSRIILQFPEEIEFTSWGQCYLEA